VGVGECERVVDGVVEHVGLGVFERLGDGLHM
jgi:hypothetical protein